MNAQIDFTMNNLHKFFCAVYPPLPNGFKALKVSSNLTDNSDINVNKTFV